MKLTLIKVALVALLLPINSLAGLITVSDSDVTSSSQLGTSLTAYHHSNVVDGNFKIGESTTDTDYWNAGTFNAWLQVDLGDVYTIDKVSLSIASGISFNILVGDGTTWSVLNQSPQFTGPKSFIPGPTHKWTLYDIGPTDINSLSGQFVRYNVSGTSANHHAHLAEIAVFGTLANQTNSTQVPEPSIIALMGLGIFGLGLSRRKMKK